MKPAMVRKVLHLVHTEEPHISSFAAAVLLHRSCQRIDEDYIEDADFKFRLAAGTINKGVIRRVFFRRLQKQGRLFCVLCKRDDLIVRYPSRRKKKALPVKRRENDPDNLATIDHIIPLCEGGLKYSTRNMMCLCNSCNNKKSNYSVIKTSTGYMLNG